MILDWIKDTQESSYSQPAKVSYLLNYTFSSHITFGHFISPLLLRLSNNLMAAHHHSES